MLCVLSVRFNLMFTIFFFKWLNIKATVFYPKSYPSSPDPGRKLNPVDVSADTSLGSNNNVSPAASPKQDLNRSGDAKLARVTSLNAMANEFVPQQQTSPLHRVHTSPGTMHHYNGAPEEYLERKCCRCSKLFYMSPLGEYLTVETCHYHPGKKLSREEVKRSAAAAFSCCAKE